MTSNKEKRLKRLVEVRKRQRDEVGAAVLKARAVRDEKDARYRQSLDEVNAEIEGTRVLPFEALDPEQRRLQIECLMAAQAQAVAREIDLKQAENLLSNETKRLSAAHAKVRQMEILADAQRKADVSRADKAEQKESDDLCATKERGK